MAVVVLGSAEITSTSQSVTVPSGCKKAVFVWDYWDGGGSGYGLASASLGGVSPTRNFELAGNGDVAAAGFVEWDSPAPGSLTLAHALDATPEEGPTRAVIFLGVEGGGEIEAQSHDIDADGTASGAVGFTLSGLAVGDLVIAFDTRSTGGGATAPGNQSGWTSALTTGEVANRMSRLRSIYATGATQSVASQTLSYSSLVAAAYREVAPSGGSIAHILAGYQQMIGNA